MGMEKKFIDFKLQMARLCIFRELQEKPLLKDLSALVESLLDETETFTNHIEKYNCFAYRLFERNGGASLKAYIAEEVLYGQNLITVYIERNQRLQNSLREGLASELAILEEIGECKASWFKELLMSKASCVLERELIQTLIEWHTDEEDSIAVLGIRNWEEKSETLLDFYKQKGCGTFAKHVAFIWDDSKGNKEIKGIDTPDTINFNDLIGYELQKQDLIHNTEAFIKGYPANNLLLYGARGTGKSSMVKATLNYFAKGTRLRLIEVRKDQLMQLKELISVIKNKPYYFVIFIDDLAFEDKEETYTALKTILEGGVEAKPNNMVIYATSNRRHLIQENMSDNELHGKDTVEEKLSLSDRFGMRIGFNAPNQLEYLAIVKGLVAQRGIDIEEELLKKEALKWEMWHNGKSGRTAKQFVDDLEGR